MKYGGRITLLFLALLTSIVFLVKGNDRDAFFFIYSFFHACFSWVFGGWYDKAKFLSFHDPLTGVFNRRYAYKTFAKKFQRAKQRNEKIGILNIDVDHFKSINDTFGHTYGDFILKEISRFIKESIGKEDMLVRWGGDEFLVLFVNRDKESARQLIDQINETLKVAVRACEEEKKTEISLSIGFSIFPDDAGSLHELIAVADERMYKMKKMSKINLV